MIPSRNIINIEGNASKIVKMVVYCKNADHGPMQSSLIVKLKFRVLNSVHSDSPRWQLS